ncbi:MAG TPA: glycoside hydrolase family 38 C-terminal domain-containing protein [Leifsonia sp.]|nr:glycoside hydrolase family 38 C-terminal domain-containing protein [Leifsonia sp.]
MLRLKRLVVERLSPAQYRHSLPLHIEAWDVPDEPVPFDAAVAQAYRSFAVGEAWGRPWGTTWFHVTGTVPTEWHVTDGQLELVVDLGFTLANPGFQAEGLVYTPEGRILKGLEPRAGAVRLDVRPGDSIDLYIEAAGNPDVQEGLFTFSPMVVGRKSTAGSEPRYRLRRIDVALLDLPVWELIQDVRTLEGLALTLPTELPRRAEIVAALDRMVDVIDPEDVSGTASDARQVLESVLAAPAAPSAHRVVAVGHAHIDSAWLWPVRETVRKCARTFSNVLALMDEDPTLVFACSSAQQFAWMKQYYPEVFERIRQRVAEGRFVPVGGMWVESDTNMPGGEALARQFVAGKRFFLEEFGYEPREVWLPDSFGYSAALPQIAKAAGSDAFLTQKLSWNETNVFPHSTFLWEGIDGSRILTHFPPVNSYNSELSGAELALAQRNHVEKAQSNTSLVPFGFGDGGGGPTREMLAAAKRARSLEGSPAVTVASPQAFFDAARSATSQLGVWAGELYLEFHRGTYTSQARTKQGNRRSERLLHEAELWAATAAVRAGAPYPYDELESAWHTVLLQQFHDILPGSSIGWVHDQAVENYGRVAGALEALIADAFAALGDGGADDVVFNSAPYAVRGVPALGSGPVSEDAAPVRLERSGEDLLLDNGLVRVTVDSRGLIVSLVDLKAAREVVPAGTYGNLLQLFRDTPTQWDAWDVDKEYRRVGRDLTEAQAVEVVEEDGEPALRITRRFGASSIEQILTVPPGIAGIQIRSTVDWHERKKLLKLAFPVDVHTDRATSEIQFGHIHRATHTNTSWDVARFETSAHRWVHVADASFGVAVANDSTYGHDITRARTEEGRSFSLVRESLLRAPVYPDPEADQGGHVLTTSLVVGGIPAAVEEGYRLNLPLRAAVGAPVVPLVSSDDPGVVIETVKLAEDRSGDVVVRLYESRGGRASATITPSFDHSGIVQTDLLERAVPGLRAGAGECAELVLDPFQLVTLRFTR